MANVETKQLTEAQDRFVAAWGKMGTAWGISRTMAEVHALLYITGEPLCTDDVMERLQISRGNASMSLRALLEWGIVERVHRRGDRKEYFQAEQDVWVLFRAIVRERMKREVDPMRASLYEIRDLTEDRVSKDAKDPALVAHNKRLDSMLEFLETMEKMSASFVSPAGRGLQAAAKILGFVGGGRAEPRPSSPGGSTPDSEREAG
ncbi:MAG: ArsR family transcriptional regulator [Phycisphaerales bacterium]|nr:ArsR family transcriptional regulator [Phycisphaerales bacterium]